MSRVLSIFFVILSLIVVLPLAGCSAGSEPVLNSEEEALSKAKELFPEYFKEDAKDIDVSHSDEVYEKMGYPNILHEKSWGLHWQDENGYIHVGLSADDGSLSSFGYQQKNIQDLTVGKFFTRKEAEKIAYDFASRFHQTKLDSMVPDKDRSEYADESHLNLEYDFAWNRVIDDIPVLQDSIGVSVNALTGKVTSLYCEWNEVDQPKVRIMSSEGIADSIIGNVGLLPTYNEAPSPEGNFLTAKLVYRPNTSYNIFSAVSGAPQPYYGEKTSLMDSKTFDREFNLLPAPEQKVSVPVPDTRKTFEEAEKLAAAFLEKQGHKGSLKKGGNEWDSGPPYAQESWRFALGDSVDSQWEDVSVWVDSGFGRIYRFSRMPKEEQILAPFLWLSLEEAEQSALEFLAAMDEDTRDTVMRVETRSYVSNSSQKKIDAYAFTWIRLVNGVPFYGDRLTLGVSRNTGEVLGFERDYTRVSVFESTTGLLSPEDAVAAWKTSEPLKLCYMLTGDPLREKLKLRLVYNLSNYSIDAHTGEKIEDYNTKRLGPYLEKIEGHWAEIPLDLLAQTGRLPAPEDFDPDNTVTRREVIRVLELAGHRDSEAGLHSPFEDISVNDPDIWAILHTVWSGVIEPGGNLKPEELLTREDATVWLIKLLGNVRQEKLSSSTSLDFNDAQMIHPDKRDYVAIAQEHKIISADKNGSFRPQAPVTWSELAAMLARAIPKLEDY